MCCKTSKNSWEVVARRKEEEERRRKETGRVGGGKGNRRSFHSSDVDSDKDTRQRGKVSVGDGDKGEGGQIKTDSLRASHGKTSALTVRRRSGGDGVMRGRMGRTDTRTSRAPGASWTKTRWRLTTRCG
jgi:hypothetical protein